MTLLNSPAPRGCGRPAPAPRSGTIQNQPDDAIGKVLFKERPLPFQTSLSAGAGGSQVPWRSQAGPNQMAYHTVTTPSLHRYYTGEGAYRGRRGAQVGLADGAPLTLTDRGIGPIMGRNAHFLGINAPGERSRQPTHQPESSHGSAKTLPRRAARPECANSSFMPPTINKTTAGRLRCLANYCRVLAHPAGVVVSATGLLSVPGSRSYLVRIGWAHSDQSRLGRWSYRQDAPESAATVALGLTTTGSDPIMGWFRRATGTGNSGQQKSGGKLLSSSTRSNSSGGVGAGAVIV